MRRTTLGRHGQDTSRLSLGCLDAIVPADAAAGERYRPAQIAHLDSEMG